MFDWKYHIPLGFYSAYRYHSLGFNFFGSYTIGVAITYVTVHCNLSNTAPSEPINQLTVSHSLPAGYDIGFQPRVVIRVVTEIGLVFLFLALVDYRETEVVLP